MIVDRAAPRDPATRARRVGTVVLWVAVFGFTWLLMLRRLVIVRDEAWMLWIATRVARGETLYRDVYDVTTPLAAWLAAAVVRTAGSQMAAIRAVSAAIFATEVVVGVSVVRRAGSGPVGRAVLVAVLIGVAAPSLAFVSLYSGLAICFALATLRATFWWFDTVTAGRRAAGAAVTVGVLGAGAFWSKPNVGVLVALAVGAVVLTATPGAPARDRLASVARMVVGALVVSAGCLAVVVATGAGSDFVGQVFASKGEYVQLGFGYLPALGDRVSGLLTGATPFAVRRVVGVVVQASPLVLLVAAVVGAFRARRAPAALRVATVGFAFAGLLSLLPRPGLNHIVGVVPLVLVSVVAGWALGNRAEAPAGVAVRTATVAVAVAAVVAIGALVVPAVWPPHSARSSAEAAHFRGTPVSDRQLRSSARLARDLRSRGVDEVFIVRKDAGFLYLRTGTTDPLPFDIVERSDLGADDEAGVIRRLERGDARWACVRRPGSGGAVDRALVPRRLEAWIRANFTFAGSVARCDLYRAPGAPRAGR